MSEKLKFWTVIRFDFFFFFLSDTIFHLYYFAYLADGEAPRFFSAHLGTFQLYICAKEKKSFFSDTATSIVNRLMKKRLQPLGEKEDEMVASFQRETA